MPPRAARRRDARLRARVRHDRRARRIGRSDAASRSDVAFPALDDDPERILAAMARALAFLLRVGVRDERPCLRRSIRSSAATSRAICAPTGADLRGHRPIDQGPPALPASARRGGQALQRAAEARLSRGDLRAAAADHPDGRLAMSPWLNSIAPGLGRLASAGGSRRARFISSSRGCWSRSSLIHVFEVIDHRALEPPALDDHRPLSHRRGGAMT